MNEISSSIARLQPMQVEAKINFLAQKTKCKLKKPPKFQLIALDKEITGTRLQNSLNDIDNYYSYANNCLSTIQTQIQTNRLEFQKKTNQEKHNIDKQYSDLEKRMKQIKHKSTKLNEPTPQNIATLDILIKNKKQSLSNLEQKEIAIKNECQLALLREPILRKNIKTGREELTDIRTKLLNNIDSVHQMLDRNNKANHELEIQNCRQRILILSDQIDKNIKEREEITNRKQQFLSKEKEVQKTKTKTTEVKKILTELEKTEKSIEKFVSKDKLMKIIQENRKTQRALKEQQEVLESCNKLKEKLKNRLRKVKDEIKEEDETCDFIEDEFFGDTEETKIQISGPVPIQKKNQIPKENTMKGIEILRNELKKDIKSLDNELHDEQMNIWRLKKQINEITLSKMEKFPIISEDKPSVGELKIDVEKLEWKIKMVSQNIEMKKQYVTKFAAEQFSTTNITPLSLAIFQASIETEIEKWKEINPIMISNELCKWNMLIPSL